VNTERVGGWLEELLAGVGPGLLYDVFFWLLAAAAVSGGVHLARRWVGRHIEDVNRRHRIRKWIGYSGAVLLVLLAGALLVGRSLHVTAILGILGAGAAIALQDTAKNAIGWVYLTGRRGLGPGARVEIDELEGEVIDVGVLKTTILEVGNRVYGRQSSGRLASVPNSRFINTPVRFFPDYSPYVWQEIQFLLTYESDWERGVRALERIGREEYGEVASGAESGFRELQRRYAFKHGPLTPIVYLEAADSGVRLTLRYLSHIRQARGSADRVGRAMLRAVESDPALEFAYPTWRLYRRGEEGGPPPETPEGPAGSS